MSEDPGGQRARQLRQRLGTRAVLRHLEALSGDLTPNQLGRLRALAEAIGPDGAIALATALDIATPGGDDAKRQSTFRKFRAALADASAGRLTLEVDTSRSGPQQRSCWFAGRDTVDEETAELSERTARRLTREASVPTLGQEVLTEVTAYVSTVDVDPAPAEDARRFVEAQRDFVRRLTARAGLRHTPRITVTTMLDPPVGKPVQEHRERLRATADVVLVLVSPQYCAGGPDGAWLW
jgi:NACHT N-terminal Helical domain 6